MKLPDRGIQGLGLLFLLLASIFSVGFHHFDEHWQILEFAGWKMGWISSDKLPWEFHQQMRPALQPGLVVGSYEVLDLLGIRDPFSLAFCTRLISAALFFSSMLLLFKVYEKEFRGERFLRNWLLVSSFLLWFLIYNGVRFSSENWSGNFFIIGFATYFLLRKERWIPLALTGFLLGISFLCRYQAGFFILGFLSWILLIQKKSHHHLFKILSGLAFALVGGYFIDLWFYGDHVLTAWNYLGQNLLQDRISDFGRSPWWFYFKEAFLKGIPPFSLLFILSVLFLLPKYRDPLPWVIFPFLLLHFLIGHKEFRFLFPMLGFLPIISTKGLQTFKDKGWIAFGSKWFKAFIGMFIVVNFFLLLYISFRPAEHHVNMYEKIYRSSEERDTLYYVGENPYNRVLEVSFYRREELVVKALKGSMKEIKERKDGSEKILIAYKSNEFPGVLEEKGELLYSTYPRWILDIEFNEWKERTNIWYLFLLNRKKALEIVNEG